MQTHLSQLLNCVNSTHRRGHGWPGGVSNPSSPGALSKDPLKHRVSKYRIASLFPGQRIQEALRIIPENPRGSKPSPANASDQHKKQENNLILEPQSQRECLWCHQQSTCARTQGPDTLLTEMQPAECQHRDYGQKGSAGWKSKAYLAMQSLQHPGLEARLLQLTHFSSLDCQGN